MNWTLTDAVFADSNNFFAAGDLDFMYQIAFTGTAAVNTVGASSFAGFSTDAGYTASSGGLPGGVFVNGVLHPFQDSRSADGAAVTFAWTNSGKEGVTYNLAIVETNATLYDGKGVASVTINAVDPVASIFEPVAVPEPRPFAPLAGSLMLWAVDALRRRRI